MKGLFVVAGEISGDLHGAELLRALVDAGLPREDIRGLGGPKMRDLVGNEIVDWLDQAAVMGIVEVLKHYRFFKRHMELCETAIRENPPRILLLIDYPGFNLRLAKRVRAISPETTIVQYVCPQVWAWKKGRIPKIAQIVDRLYCLFPFEPALFADYDDISAKCLGHPCVDELTEIRDSSTIEREPDLIGLFPGSRVPEIERLLPVLLATAQRLAEANAHLRFSIPAATPALKQLIEAQITANPSFVFPIEVTDGGSHELMQRAGSGILASGTATLEAAFFGLPHCIIYKLAPVTYAVAKLVVKIEHIGIINVLAGRTVVREFIQGDADPVALATELQRWIDHPSEAKDLQKDMAEVIKTLGQPGVHQRIAADLLGRP